MTRNILNLWDLDRFLANIEVPDEDKPIRRWIDRIARRWILKDYRATGRVLSVEQEPDAVEGEYAIGWLRDADSRGVTQRRGPVPPWLESALAKGVYWLDLDGPSGKRLSSQLHAVALYFDNLKGSPEYARLNRVAFPDAVAAAYRFRDLVAERDGAKPDNTLLAFENGYRFALLTTPKDLEIEGRRMRHCVGDYDYEVERGSDIVSLRGPDDRPHVTLEILGGREVVQIKGKANASVAPRYRRYVACFIRDMELEVTGDRENAGITSQPMDLCNPQGWLAERNLRDLIQREIDGRRYEDQRGRIEAFYADAQTEIRSMSDETWDWFVDLFRDPRGRFCRFYRQEAYEVGGRRFGVFGVRFPDRLYDVLRQAGGGRAQALRRALTDELENLLLGFGRRDAQALVALWSFEAPLGLDLRRLRHEHQQRVSRRLAAARREMRRKAFATRAPYAALSRWESARRSFVRHLQDEAEAYL